MASCEPLKDECESKRQERRQQVMLGDLPADFLRITPISSEQQLSLDEQTALALQHQFTVSAAISGRLTVTVVEAKLNKNYGLSRMDPYVRLRIGNTIYETSTHYNGARNPRWDKSFNCFHSPHDKTINIELFDECAFSLDERIAWASYDIPDTILSGKTEDVWLELNGKLGEKKEGLINFVITCQPVPSGALIYHPKSSVTVLPYPPATHTSPQNAPLPDLMAGDPTMLRHVSEVSEEDLKMISDMFPNLDEEIVRAIMESNHGNKDHSINALLELSDVT